MQHDFATIAEQTGIPQFGAARRYGTKNKNELKMTELPKGRSHSPKITTKNENQTMDQNNGPQAKLLKEEIRITILMDLQKIFLHLIEISLQGLTSYLRTIIRTAENHIIDAQTTFSKEIMEIDLELNISTTRMGTGETMEIFLVLHRLKEDTSHKKVFIANQEVSNRTTLRFTDLTINLRLVLRAMNKSFRRTIIRHHLMWFASPQLMILLKNY